MTHARVPFLQDPPQLPHPFTHDHALRAHLQRVLPPEVLDAETPRLQALGDLVSSRLEALALAAEANPPRLVQYDAWGKRIDRVEVCDAWRELLAIAAREGLVSVAYERPYGEHSRVAQVARVHLYGPVSAIATCPLAMTDGCARVMETWAKGMPFAEEVRERLISTDPATAWTAGQWMTEKEGGSDISRTSTLARPEGAGPGSRALDMFFLEPWDETGQPNALEVRRLKDKLGTRALPTAELELRGTIAHRIGDPDVIGIRKIATVLNICRYWNTMSAAHLIARCVALATDYASRRDAFGAKLIDLPLHAETLAKLQTEYEGALAVTLRVAQLLGKTEVGVASEAEEATWRLLTPLAKLMTGKQAVAVASETLEAFGGAGYMEGTGLPRLLRDAQVLPIWEGTTNVLSLDALRAIAKEAALGPLLADAAEMLSTCQGDALSDATAQVREALSQLTQHAKASATATPLTVQAHARRFAMGLARTYTAALLCQAAQHALELGSGSRAVHLAERWIQAGLFTAEPLDDARLSANREILFL